MTAAARPVLFAAAGTSADGDPMVVATEYAGGPWNPAHCHGGPPSALLARACERAADGADDSVEWQVARLTVELTRPVPVGVPIAVETDIERPGRKISMVAARLRVDDTVVAHARCLRIRRAHISLPEHPVAPPDFTTPAGEGVHQKVTWMIDDGDDGVAFHRSGCEHRFVEGGWNEDGPCKVWIRLLADLVEGESPTGVQRAVAAADFGNGVSGALDADVITYINPDLTVHLARPPVGEWIGLASNSVYGANGVSSGAGFAESALSDELGRLGRSVQSLILQES